MEKELLQAFLPELLLGHFEVVNFFELGNIATKKMEFELHLDEHNELPLGYSTCDYESKGFLPSSRIQDFPIRGKTVYLEIRRRRWRHKETGKEISNNYSFMARGSRLTKELSDFLKGTGGYQGRYDK